MKRVIETIFFIRWANSIKDSQTIFRIYERIKRLCDGNPGDTKSIGGGLFELRINFGPGYRIYFKDTGNEIIFLLCGGDKSSQKKDIQKAKLIAQQLKKENYHEKNFS
jgi:putative addiction module killer protein